MAVSLIIAFWDTAAFGQASDVWLAKCLGVRRVTILRMRSRRGIPVFRGPRSFKVVNGLPKTALPWHLVDWTKTNEQIAIETFGGKVSLLKVAFIRTHRGEFACPFIPTLELVEKVLHERKS